MIKLLPLQGVLLIAIIPRAMPWARSFWAFSPYLNHMRNFSLLLFAVFYLVVYFIKLLSEHCFMLDDVSQLLQCFLVGGVRNP